MAANRSLAVLRLSARVGWPWYSLLGKANRCESISILNIFDSQWHVIVRDACLTTLFPSLATVLRLCCDGVMIAFRCIPGAVRRHAMVFVLPMMHVLYGCLP